MENHYPTMKTADICALKFYIARDAVLYLWATAPKLEDALRVMKAWGFAYKTQMVWDKGSPAYGFWFRGQHEILLVGTKGKFSPPKKDGKWFNLPSVWREKRTRHSAKPKGIRDYIKAAFPDARRLEVFARDVAEGWDCWGDGVRDCLKSEKRRTFGLFPVAFPLSSPGTACPIIVTSQFTGETVIPECILQVGGPAKPGWNSAGTGCPPTASWVRQPPDEPV